MKKTNNGALLTASLITFGSLVGGANAAVTWLVTENSGNLILTTSGSLDAGTVTDTSSGGGASIKLTTNFVWGRAGAYRTTSAGTRNSDVLPTPLDITGSSMTGHTFGFESTGNLIWDPIFGDTPGVFTPIQTLTFSGRTIANTFGTSLDAGPITVWTHDTTGDTINIGFTAVPEPSSTALLGLGALALVMRRRK